MWVIKQTAVLPLVEAASLYCKYRIPAVHFSFLLGFIRRRKKRLTVVWFLLQPGCVWQLKPLERAELHVTLALAANTLFRCE